MDDAVRCGNAVCAGILAMHGGKAGRRHSVFSSIQSRAQPDGDSFHENDGGDDGSDSSLVSVHEMADEKTTIPGRTIMARSSCGSAI